MTTQPHDSRALALAFLGHCFRCDAQAVMSLLAPDASWWVLGDPQKLRVSGRRDRARIERFVRKVGEAFPGGLQATIEGVTAQDDRVAVEATSYAQLPDGREYRNRYHFLIRVQDGKVIEMREYLDTLYAFEAQQASRPPAGG